MKFSAWIDSFSFVAYKLNLNHIILLTKNDLGSEFYAFLSFLGSQIEGCWIVCSEVKLDCLLQSGSVLKLVQFFISMCLSNRFIYLFILQITCMIETGFEQMIGFTCGNSRNLEIFNFFLFFSGEPFFSFLCFYCCGWKYILSVHIFHHHIWVCGAWLIDLALPSKYENIWLWNYRMWL